MVAARGRSVARGRSTPAKRVNSTPVEKEAKQPRVDVRISSIVDVLEKAEQPEPCRAMMVALAHCLLTPNERRHELQSVGVSIVEETLQQTKDDLVASIATCQKRLSELEQSKEELQARAEEAEAASKACAATEKAEEAALREATSGVSAARKVQEEKSAVRAKVEKDLAAANEEKTSSEATMEEHMRAPLAAGEGPHYFFLKGMVGKLGLEESFTNALPSSCIKTKEQRGQFDVLVLSELEKALDRHLVGLASAAVEAAAVVPAAVEAAAAAEAQLREAEAAADAAEKALKAAKDQATTAVNSLEAAREAADAVQPSIIAERSKQEALKSDLDELEKGPLVRFAELRDQCSKDKPEEAAPAGA